MISSGTFISKRSDRFECLCPCCRPHIISAVPAADLGISRLAPDGVATTSKDVASGSCVLAVVLGYQDSVCVATDFALSRVGNVVAHLFKVAFYSSTEELVVSPCA